MALMVSLFAFCGPGQAQPPPPQARKARQSPSRWHPAQSGDPSIRPFKIEVPQAALDDLRRRIDATRWPDRETVNDRSQGAQLANLQELVRSGHGLGPRARLEARLNALPQFNTTIDGLDIHFIHVRSVIRTPCP